MPPLLRSVIYLRPPKGPVLVLKDEETWIGRGSFELSEKSQSVCSRRQACLKHTKAVVQLECHGLNPIYFVVCQSVSFQASQQDIPLSSLHLLRKGEVVELTDGDKFFLAPKECLLTVGIKHIKSGDDDTALQLTPDAGHFNVHYDKSVANEIVSPKATQNDQVSAIGHLQQSELPQTGASARWLCAEVQVPTTDRCLTGDVSNVDSTKPKCFTCSVDGDCICNAVDAALDPPLPGSQVSLISNCSIGEAALLKTVASGDRALIGTTTSVVASKTCVVPDSQSAPGLQGLAESPATESRCFTSTQGGTLAAGSSVEERECGPTIDFSGEILVQCQLPDTGSGRLDSRGPLKGVEVDHNDVDQASKHIISSNGTGGILPALLSEPNQIQENKPSADICRVELKQEQSQSWQPGHSSNLSHVSSPLPFPCNSDVAVAALLGNTILQDLCEKEGNVHTASTSEPAPSSDRRSVDPTFRELPVAMEEYKLLDGRRMPTKQLGLVDLTTPENNVQVQSQIQSQTVHLGPCMPNNYGVGPVEGMETVTATVSGYDDVLRVRLVNLINLTGAAYTGSLTKSNTHVVCWKFKGAKYEMARKLGKSIVNHQWFEDCLRAGVRLPEGPYESSGEMAEPLYWSHSSVQHPSSKACEQHSDPLFMEEHSQGLLQPVTVVGGSSVPSTHSGRIVEHTGQSTLPSKCNSDKLDRGKRHSVVDLNSPANRQQVFDIVTPTHDRQDVCQISCPRRARNALAIDLSTPHGAQEQESDEFWNEVIRTYDNKGKQVADHTSQVHPETLPSAELKHHRARRARHASSPNAGSSSGELDAKVDDEIRRDLSDNEAHASEDIESERLHEAMQSHLSMREPSGIVYSEDGHRTSYPKVLLRKRKLVSATLSSQINRKHRRLVRKRESLGETDEESVPVGCSVVMGGIRTGDQSNFISDPTQQRPFKVDRKDEYEQTAGSIDSLIGSAGKTGEKVGESLSGDEITCVICHSETKLVTEGVLTCGHKFCYPCIQRWADEAKSKSPTCPLCKVSFEFITYREMGNAAANGSCSSVLEERVVEVGQDTRQEARHTNLPSLRTENLCVTCGSRDTSELLLRCTNCRERACHTFCLDPPRPPGSSWFCSRCSQTQSRMQTREAYGRLFQGSSPRSSLQRRSDMGDLGLNPVTQNGFTSRVGALVPGQSSRTPPRRRRQHSLYSYLVRDNDV